MMAPSILIRLIDVPVIQSAISTPLSANGMENMMMNGSVSDSNCAAITMNTSIMISRASVAISANDSCWSS